MSILDPSCHPSNAPNQGRTASATASADGTIALIGAPNCGKTSLFNHLTGLRAKTGNYPGVTVTRSVGTLNVAGKRFLVEDLPGSYSLTPMSPDEQVVTDVLDGRIEGVDRPDALLVVADATTLRRSLVLLAEVLRRHEPTALVLTMTDELRRRGGSLDAAALSRALGIPVITVIANRGIGVPELRRLITEWERWSEPPLDTPSDASELSGWTESILQAAGYSSPAPDPHTERIDSVLLHPLWGTIVFFATMFVFFQALFTWAAPVQDLIETGFSTLSGAARDAIPDPTWGGLVADGIIGGVGAVLVFLPQILLMYLLLAVLDSVGYMARAAFLMDRIMSGAGLEGRAFVAVLSAFACAIPGIMATRTIPSSRDRIATMLGVPLATCSARLPVYLLLVGMLVPEDAWFGPVSGRGLVMFGMYLLGGISALVAAWAVKKITDRSGHVLPFYMELPPYRFPTPRSVGIAMWEPTKAFVRKAGTIVLVATIAIWALTNLPVPSSAQLAAAGVDASDDAAVAQYTIEHSPAAEIGKAMEPVFAPLGFDWRVNIAIVGSLAAREVAVSTLGQIASAGDPEDESSVAEQLQTWTYTDGPRAGEPVFSAATVTAMLLFFAFALQCMSTVAVMRRESGGWKWPGIAFTYMLVLGWTAGFLGHTVVTWMSGGGR